MANESGGALKSINGIVVFLLEVSMLVVFGSYGYYVFTNIWLRLGLAAGLVVVAVAVWGVLAAPRSTRRLPMPALAVFRGAMFLLAAFFVYRLGYRNGALVFAAVAVITQVVSCFTEW